MPEPLSPGHDECEGSGGNLDYGVSAGSLLLYFVYEDADHFYKYRHLLKRISRKKGVTKYSLLKKSFLSYNPFTSKLLRSYDKC